MVPFGVRDDCREQCVKAGDPQGGSIRFQFFPLDCCPIADQWLWHYWASMLTFLIDTLVFTRLAVSGAFERQKQWLEGNKCLL